MVTKLDTGRDKVGIWDWRMQATVYKIDNNKVLLYSTGNYIQYLVVNNNGKESEKNIDLNVYSDTYMYLNHFAVHQKLTQHSKSTILQLKNNFFKVNWTNKQERRGTHEF